MTKKTKPGRLLLHCPSCKKALDGHITSEGKYANPSLGDVGICVYCHNTFIMGKNNTLCAIKIEDIPYAQIRKQLLIATSMLKLKCDFKKTGEYHPANKEPTKQ